MKYLSFDIGIKNLAYTILEKDEETKEIKIIEWNIINIMEEDINKQKICDLEKCKKFAEYYNKKECNTFLCKTHYKKHNKRLNRIKIINCNNVNTFDVMNKMYDLLDRDYKYFLDCDLAILEMQPVKRQQMRSIANLLYAYFNLRGVREDVKMSNVVFTNACNKLKYSFDEEDNKKKNTYSERKKLAIVYTYDYLDKMNDEDNRNLFTLSKKKDDLADCLLQCIFYIENIEK